MDVLQEDLESLTALVPRLAGAFQRYAARNLTPFGLTVPQFITLDALRRFEGGARMGPLATAALQSAASMTGIVDRLLERGLVERRRDAGDRRSVVVQLTDQGRDLLGEVRAKRNQQWRELLGHFPPQDRERMRAILSALVEVLDQSIED